MFVWICEYVTLVAVPTVGDVLFSGVRVMCIKKILETHGILINFVQIFLQNIRKLTVFFYQAILESNECVKWCIRKSYSAVKINKCNAKSQFPVDIHFDFF